MSINFLLGGHDTAPIKSDKIEDKEVIKLKKEIRELKDIIDQRNQMCSDYYLRYEEMKREIAYLRKVINET